MPDNVVQHGPICIEHGNVPLTSTLFPTARPDYVVQDGPICIEYGYVPLTSTLFSPEYLISTQKPGFTSSKPELHKTFFLLLVQLLLRTRRAILRPKTEKYIPLHATSAVAQTSSRQRTRVVGIRPLLLRSANDQPAPTKTRLGGGTLQLISPAKATAYSPLLIVHRTTWSMSSRRNL